MKYLILSLTAILSLSSCSHYFYAPNCHNAPMMREKNEARAMVAFTTADEMNGTECQFAYSPINHLGLTIDYANAHGGSGFNSGNGHQLEAGIGYYLPFHRKMTLECYGGYGGGSVFNQFDSLETYKLDFRKVFIQPGFGYTSDYFDAIVSMRLAYLSIKSDDVSAVFPVPEVEQTPRSFLFEPSVTVRGGWKFIKLQMQWSNSENLSNSDFPQEKDVFSIGLYASFSPRWLNEKRKLRY